MEIRPILSAMFRNKTGAVLVALQTALTLAVVVNAVFIIQQRLEFINRPSGMDIDNIIVARSQGFGQDYAHEATVADDLATLRGLPGVIDAMPANATPLSGGGSAQGYKAEPGDDAVSHSANYYFTDDHALETLGVTLAGGRNFLPTEIGQKTTETYGQFEDQVIITQALADKLFPDGNALGKPLYSGLDKAAEIVGIIELMHGAWPSWDGLDQVMLRPAIDASPGIDYLVRVQPGQREALIPVIEERLSENRTRLVRSVKSMEEVAAHTYASSRATAIVLMTVIVLLVSVTGLGIVGLATFSVRQRTKQIGTRRAVGARKIDIIRYYMTENWLMTTMGVALGTVLAFVVNFFLATHYSLERLDPLYVPVGIVALWALGLLAVLGPARRAAQISPAVATRTV